VPGGTYQDIAALTTDQRTVDGRIYYQSRADITKLVAAAGRGDYSLADIALSASSKDANPNYYGGFTITVIYELNSLPESKVALFTSSQWVDVGSPADFSFVTDGPSTVTIGWTTWEGDRGYSGDMVRLDGDNFTPLGWNAATGTTFTANSGNAADSTAFGGKWSNTLGVDAKTFVSKTPPAGKHTIAVTSTLDYFLIGSLTVTVAAK
jgi:hypothetical protein